MKFSQKAAALLAAFFLLGTVSLAAPEESTFLRDGCYIYLGSYMGEPILWRCIGKDENGALLVSRDILCFKAFSDSDALWSSSFLRTWLNSDEKHISWENAAPDSENIDGNAYADESGFLCGFSADELRVINPVVQKSVINSSLSQFADTGTESHVYYSQGMLSKAIQNYSDAFGVTTQDKVFCLSLVQAAKLASSFPSELVALPTQKALEKSGNIKNKQNRTNSLYWLRDGIGNSEFPNVLRCVFPDGRVFFSESADSSVGVRPGIYVNPKLNIQSGSGYESSPYVIAGEKGTSAEIGVGSSSKNSEKKSLSGQYSSVSEGDYLSMGSYNGREIIWRCVEINENGPLMVSEKIIGFNAFDAAGEHGLSARKSGSNNWEMSTVRYWLNSADGEGDKSWPCQNPPYSEKVGGANGYARKKGFLQNFSPEELCFVKTTNVKTVIHPCDLASSDGGIAPLEQKRNINSPLNFGEAFYSLSSDKFFLLSLEEARSIKENFGDFFLASPTAEAAVADETASGFSPGMSSPWWLRDACTDENREAYVRLISADGWVDSKKANSGAVGLRPAFYLDMENAAFVQGDGTYQAPYKAASHSFDRWQLTKKPSCTLAGEVSRQCLTCSYVQKKSTPATGHSFKEVRREKHLFYTVVTHECSLCQATYSEKKLGALTGICLVAAAVFITVFMLLRKKYKK